MKVVIFCGGMGLRLREHEEQIPKPMAPIGYRPVLWHLMKYYAHYGHTEFILCLGYRADVIKDYFLNYDETMSNDFVLEAGGKNVTLLQSDIDNWRITFIDTGLASSITQRLKQAQPYLGDDPIFLANYADVLTDAPLPDMIAHFEQRRAIAQMLVVQPNSYTFHLVGADDAGWVTRMDDIKTANIWINGGYLVLRKEIFDFIGDGEELVVEPFQRLAEKRELAAYRHSGFWAPMDTLKDKQMLNDLHRTGQRPWCVWEKAPLTGETD
jgi:glucose-1-phosphate cytidylyltransferase